MSGKLSFVDMMNRKVDLDFPPKKIISLVPSQTELLFDLGLDKEVIGITKFCVHPDKWFREKKRIGGTKKLHLDEILSLNPDLIIANKEENTQAEIEFLAQRLPVWISDIRTIDDGLEMIRRVGDLTGKKNQALQLCDEILKGFSGLTPAYKPLSVAYFIWKSPWMSVGNDTFIHDVTRSLGWQNVYAHHTRYPETSIGELIQLNPDLVLLSSEPYPFKEQHIAELSAMLPNAKILLADGEMFSWYGSRMRLAVSYFHSLLSTI